MTQILEVKWRNCVPEPRREARIHLFMLLARVSLLIAERSAAGWIIGTLKVLPQRGDLFISLCVCVCVQRAGNCWSSSLSALTTVRSRVLCSSLLTWKLKRLLYDECLCRWSKDRLVHESLDRTVYLNRSDEASPRLLWPPQDWHMYPRLSPPIQWLW